MEKSQAIIILASALCLLSIVGVSNADIDQLSVEGEVYCDPCRLEFMTRVSYFMEGATVRLRCKNITTGLENFNEEVVTNKSGNFVFKVSRDLLEEETCRVTLVKSGRDDCNEPIDFFTQDGFPVLIFTSNNGKATSVHVSVPLGFVNKEPIPECEAVIKELEMDYTDNNGSAHGGAQFTFEPIAPKAAVDAPAGASGEASSGSGAEAGAGGEAGSRSGSGSGSN